MPEIDWKQLTVGDRVTFHELPEGYLHPETRAVYEHLIQTQTILRVDRIDDDGYPWVEFDLMEDGERVWHSLMINHEGLELSKT